METDEEIKRHLKEGGLENVKDEVADIAVYILLLSHDLGIDLFDAMKKKLRKNEKSILLKRLKGSAKKV